MTEHSVNPLIGETLIPLAKAAEDFGGIPVPLSTVRDYVYRGVSGLKLESIRINGRFTSKEAIARFIERKQNLGQTLAKPLVKPMTQTQIDAGLRRHGLVK